MVKQHIVIGNQLRKAREVLKISLAEVEASLAVRPEEIRKWEDGEEEPSLGVLERLAEFYGREIDYFLREDIPSPPTRIQFRSVTKHPFESLPAEARRVIARFDELCRTAYELEQTLDKVQPPQIQHVPSNYSPTNLAQDERKRFGLDNKPIRNLRDDLTEKGIRIFELEIPDERISGFSYWHEVYGPCILVNARGVLGRKNFTIAHEYAHLLYHHTPSVCDIHEEEIKTNIREETLAHTFAVKFLMPAEGVRKDFEKRGLSREPSIQEVGKMAGRWYVSVQAMLYRLEGLNLIKRGHARSLLTSYQPQAPRLRPGAKRVPTWRKRLGEVYVSNAIQAYREGLISSGKLAYCLNIPLRKALEVTGQH